MKTRNILLMLAFSLTTAVACDKTPPAEPEAEAPTAPEVVEEVAEAPAEQAAVSPEEAAEEAPEVATIGQLAPDFELTDEKGNTHKLSDQKGKIVVLEWVNPECPILQRVYEDNIMQTTVAAAGELSKEKGTEIVWWAVDSSNFVKPADSTAWNEKYKVTYPTLQDPSGAVGKAYDARTTPHMYIVDTEGKLRYNGAIDDDPHGKNAEGATNHVTAALTALTSGQEVPQAETKPYGCSVKYTGS